MSDALTTRLAELLRDASDGSLDADALLDSRESLIALGVTSLTMLRLMDAIEEEFGVALDDVSVDDFASLVREVSGQLSGNAP